MRQSSICATCCQRGCCGTTKAGRAALCAFSLAPDGVYICHHCCQRCGALLPHLSNLTQHTICLKRRKCAGRFISVALSLRSPSPCVTRHPALRSSDFPHQCITLAQLPVLLVIKIIFTSSNPNTLQTLYFRAFRLLSAPFFQALRHNQLSLQAVPYRPLPKSLPQASQHLMHH